MAESDVSVVVATKNESEVIEKCLKSVFNQSVEPREVILVDGRSTDDTIEKAKNFPVKILVETGSTSPSNARNLGVQHANGEIVLIMDADAELDVYCIENAIRYFKDPNVLVVRPTREISLHTRLEKIQAKWFHGTRSKFRTGFATGSAIAFVRKEIYDKVKYDTSIGFGDDSDFFRRLRKLNPQPKSVVTADEVKVILNFPHSLSELSSQYIWYGRTSLKYFSRYHSSDALLRLGSMLMPSIVVFLCIVQFLFPSLIYLVIPFLALLIIRNIIACIRSRSTYFFEFVLFDFIRSLLFVFGIIQGFFNKRIGR